MAQFEQIAISFNLRLTWVGRPFFTVSVWSSYHKHRLLNAVVKKKASSHSHTHGPLTEIHII